MLLNSSPSRRTVSGDIVYLGGHGRPGDPLRTLLESGWNVNKEVTQPSVESLARIKKSLIWFSMYWGEAGSLQMLLAVEHPERGATLQTLEDALACNIENPDVSCMTLLRKAIDKLKQKRQRNELDAEEQRLHRELAEMRRREQEISDKLQRNRLKYKTQHEGITSKAAEVQCQVLRMQARLQTLDDDIALNTQESAQFQKQLSTAVQAIQDAERRLGDARLTYEAAVSRCNRKREEIEVIQQKKAEVVANLQQAVAALATLETDKSSLQARLSKMEEGAVSAPQSTSNTVPAPSSEASLECPICCDSRISRHLQCGHCVCVSCADHIKNVLKRCPFDRKRIEVVSPLFI